MAYAAAAAPKSSSSHSHQDLPTATGAFARLKRPHSVSLRVPSGCRVEPKEIYDICSDLFEIRPVSLSKSTNGDIIVTTNNQEQKKEILKFAAVKVKSGETLHIFDPSSPISFVSIYSVPYELHDDAIIRKLQKYGKVHSIRRCHHAEMPQCENGIRSLRMTLKKCIPSFIHFGSESFRVRYSGQLETCRRCDQYGHNANRCQRSRCFNCGMMDHTITACPLNRMCAICGSARHDISECVEWTPHEEDFDNFGLDYHTQPAEPKENEGEANEEARIEAGEEDDDANAEEENEENDDDEEEQDDGNDADDDDDEEEEDEATSTATALATNTEEQATPSAPSNPTPPNPFINIAFNHPAPKTKFSFNPSPNIFPDTQPDSLEELFSKQPPKIHLNPTSGTVQSTLQSEPPKPQRPPKKSSRKPSLPPKPSLSKPTEQEVIQPDASSSSKRALEESSGSSTVSSGSKDKKKSTARPTKKKAEQSLVSRFTNKFNSKKD